MPTISNDPASVPLRLRTFVPKPSSVTLMSANLMCVAVLVFSASDVTVLARATAVGAAFVLITLTANVSLMLARLLSVAVTLISTGPTSPIEGVPQKVRVPGVKLNQPGNAEPSAFVAVRVSESPASTSLNVSAANWNENKTSRTAS